MLPDPRLEAGVFSDYFRGLWSNILSFAHHRNARHDMGPTIANDLRQRHCSISSQPFLCPKKL